MFVDFENLGGEARVWIYQSDREFSKIEIEDISLKLEEFSNNWQRHGDDLKASFYIKYNQFIVLAVDESFNSVSGCSIDVSVNLIKKIEKQFSVDLTNKLNISFRDDSNINVVSMRDFQEFAKHKKINSNTIVFNNMVNTKSDFENNWEVSADKSWHKRFLIS